MTEETEVVETIQEPEVQEETPKEEAPKEDRNWEQAREALRMQKQEIEELKAMLAHKAQAEQPKDPDEFEGLDPDDYIKVGTAKEKLKKLAAQEAAQAAKQVVTQYAQQMRIDQDEQRMRSKHEDFDYVLENFALPLIKNDPALAYQINMSKNPAETAYKLGKLSDQYEETTMAKQPNAKAEKIMKNSSRPVSSAAAGSVLKSQADQFSKLDSRNVSDRQKIYELSQQYAKGA